MKNYIGDTYGRLTVLEVWRDTARKITFARCSCACGQEHTARIVEMRRGGVTSCGCWKQEVDSRRFRAFATKHAMSKTPTYDSWRAMRARCQSPANQAYASYGGRGIRVCERWSQSFEAFLTDMGQRPFGTTLDRIDPNGHYEPGNCRWASADVQQVNKRSTRLVEVNGEQISLRDLSRRLGISYQTLHSRLQRKSAVAIGASPARGSR